MDQGHKVSVRKIDKGVLLKRAHFFCNLGLKTMAFCTGISIGAKRFFMAMEKTQFEILVKKLTPTLKRIAYRLNGHFTHFNHEDLFQESLVHLWNNFSSGKLEDKTDSYMLQGCYFHLKNYIRKFRNYPGLISLEGLLNYGEEENQDCTFLVEDKNFPDNRQVMHNQMLADTIMNNGLTSKEKLILSFVRDGLTTREIGARLGVSHVIVVRRMGQIRLKCQKYLDKD